MLTGKDLILATRVYAKEDRAKSWFCTFSTIAILCGLLAGTHWNFSLAAKLVCSVLSGLVIVRMFVLYHDHQHGAILTKSKLADVIMTAFGIYILAPTSIWKRSHDFHHKHNCKMPVSDTGAFPTITKQQFLDASRRDQFQYLASRHPITIMFGYISVFMGSLSFVSFRDDPKKHIDCGIALVTHFLMIFCSLWFFGVQTFLLSVFIPFFVACGTGAYLFYVQHNFPGVTFRIRKDWTYDTAALESSSYMVMNPLMQWFTGNIGYHHIHHINARIPFYRLPEVMAKMPELQQVKTVTFKPRDVIGCLRLKLWDAEANRMIGLDELRQTTPHR